jgi:hypothetical protein
VAEDRPHSPFAAHIDVMQWTFLVQAGVCRVRILQNFVAENNFFSRRNNLHLLARLESLTRCNQYLTNVEFSIPSTLITAQLVAAPRSVQRFGFFPSPASGA